MWKKHIYPRIYQYNITIHVSQNVHKQFPSSIHLHFHSWSFEQKWHILLGTKRLKLHRMGEQKTDEFPNSTGFVKREAFRWWLSFNPFGKNMRTSNFSTSSPQVVKKLWRHPADVGITMESTQLTLSTMETSLLQLVDDDTLFLRIAFGWLEVDLEEFFWKHEMRWSQGSCWCILADAISIPRYQIIYINIPSGCFLGNKFFHHVRTLTTYMHPNDPEPQKRTLNPSASRKKKLGDFLRSSKQARKYWNLL